MHGSGGESLLHLSDLVTQIRSRLSFDKSFVESLYVLQTTNSPPGRRPRVEIDQNTDLFILSNTTQN